MCVGGRGEGVTGEQQLHRAMLIDAHACTHLETSVESSVISNVLSQCEVSIDLQEKEGRLGAEVRGTGDRIGRVEGDKS